MSDQTNTDVENVDPDEPAWKSDPTFNRNETQNYVSPEDRERMDEEAANSLGDQADKE
jgi:hypothetical protein